MTLFINARFLTQPTSGVQRYAIELLTALDRKFQEDDGLRCALGPVTAFHPGALTSDPGWKAIELRSLPGGSGHSWEQGALWRASRKGTLLSLGNSGPLLHQRHVLALHDANIWDIPGAFSVRYRLFHRTLRPLLACRARALITVSRFSARRLATCLGVPADRFAVIANAATHIRTTTPDLSALDRFGLRHKGYLLAVGNQSPNKNIGRLIEAHAKSGAATLPLVVAGGSAPGLSEICPEKRRRVRQLGRVHDSELRALYDGAAGFAFPSLYEGFGIPPVEAMQLGIPVLASRRTALPEVLGKAPLWFDPLSISDMVRVLRAFSELDESGRKKMTELGYRQAAKFSWERSAARLAGVLRSVAAESQPGPEISPSEPTRSGVRTLADIP